METTSPPTSDSYAEKFLAGKSIFPAAEQVFHSPGCVYDDVLSAGRADFDGLGLTVELRLRSGAAARLSARPIPGGIRVQFGKPEVSFAETSPMLLPASALGADEASPSVEFEEDETALRLRFDGYALEVDKSPFCLRLLGAAGEVIFESETERMVEMLTAPPLGLRAGDSSAERWAYLSWRMHNGERFFGLGEKFNRFEKTGTRSTIWAADTCGSSTTDMSYKAVPVLFSTAGWALMAHTTLRSHWDVGALSHSAGGLLVEEDHLDLFFLLGYTLKDLVTRYTALTGRSAVPPRWAFGIWMSRAAYRDRPEMLAAAERLRAEEIPCDVFHIDPTWMERGYYADIGVEVCNFNWDYAAWGDPRRLFEEFSALGYSICLWINPYFSEDSPAWREARERGFLALGPDGAPSRLELGLAAGIVDFTNPAARAWWQGKLADLLQKGAATFKVDFGDRVPEDARFSDGKSGREMHNLYPHLYAEAVWQVVERVSGHGLIWRRPGYIGTQRFPCCWAGDTQVSWEGMAGALRGGLSAGFTGESCWSHDIGGFVGPHPSEELYIRWAQWGLLSPFARFHGVTPREPWDYGPRALEVVKSYAHLRYALLPYLMACAGESAASGLPMLRPLVMEFPDEPRVDTIDDQYLLGSDLLVAPVFNAGRATRPVYFPNAQWWPLHVSPSAQGPAIPILGPGDRVVDAPLERLPIFVRGGAVLPRYRQIPQHLKGPTPEAWQLDIYPGDSQRRLVIAENGFTVTIQYRFERGAGKLEISPAPIRLGVRLVDHRQPPFLRASGGGPLEAGDSAANFFADASQGVSVEFRL